MRIYSLDNLKLFIISLMVVFHAAMSYMAYAPEWWYVVDAAAPSMLATVFVCWADIFIMPVMFFISGYFGLKSLTKYDGKKFWRQKLVRVILPWLLGVIIFAAPVTYIMLASRSIPISYEKFLSEMFLGSGLTPGVLFSHIHYWYLGALVVLYLLLQLAVKFFPALKERNFSEPSPLLFWVLAILPGFSVGLVSQSMPPDTWTFFSYILVLQPARIVLHLLYFFAGALAYRSHWFEEGGYVPDATPWGCAFLLASFLYLSQKFIFAPTFAPTTAAWINGFSHGIFLLTSVMFLLGFFQQKLNRTNKIVSGLAANSYGIYYIHQPILFPITWYFVSVNLPVGAKYISVSLLSLIACYLVSKIILKRIPSFK